MKNDSTKILSKVIRIDESEIRGHLDKLVRGTVEEKWTPKIGQRDKCFPGSSRQPGSGFIVHAIWRATVKRLMSSFIVVEDEISVQ